MITCLFFCLEKITSSKAKARARRQLISQDRLDMFKNRIALENWDSVYKETTADEAYRKFMEIFLSVYDSCFPIVDVTTCKNARKPWMTRRLTRLVKKKHKMFAKFIKTKNADVLLQYKSLHNSLNKEIKSARTAYYNNLFNSQLSSNPRGKWRLLNLLLNRKTQSRDITNLIIDGKEISGSCLANNFNKFFTEVG